MILVDSSVWIDYFNGKISPQTDWLDSVLGKEIIVVGDLIMVEVLQGYKSEGDFNKAKELFSHFRFMEMLGLELAIKSAQNYRYLRKKGVTVRKITDIMIGTFCIQNNIALLHDDQDFDALTKHLGLHTVI